MPGSRRWPAAVLALLGAAALAWAVWAGRGPGPGGDAGPPEFARMLSALCDAQQLVRTDVAAGRTVFYGRAHRPLHELAARLQRSDASVAARLLEAKNAAESALSAGTPPRAVEDALDVLVARTGEGLRSIGVTESGCPSQ